jgi:hypothetical protein
MAYYNTNLFFPSRTLEMAPAAGEKQHPVAYHKYCFNIIRTTQKHDCPISDFHSPNQG